VTMRRAALYARVSTELQEREQTIQSQLATITRYAEQHGLHHSPALTYSDDGYTGTRLDRPALDELRDHARERRFDVVVVLCPDRLARRYAYQVILLDELKRAGVEVLFCERPINDNPDDQLLLQIQGAIAEYERAKILDRCRRGRLHRARRGELAPPITPYGYTYGARKYGGDGQIRIHEEEAAMVRQVFAWYAAEGSTLHGVRKKLLATPWKMRRGSGWCLSRIQAILRCEWYVGRAYFNRTVCQLEDRPGEDNGAQKLVRRERPESDWIIVPVPRIIDDECFERVQQRLKENRRFGERRLKRKTAYLLKGLIKCGLCGRTFVGHTVAKVPVKWGFPEYSYYLCSSYGKAGETRCKNPRLVMAGADEIVWTTIRKLLLDSDALVKHLESWLDRTSSDPTGTERLNQATTRLSDLNRQRERLIDAYQTGALGLEDFGPRKYAIEEKILGAEQELENLRSWSSRRELTVRQVASAQAIVAELKVRLADPDFQTRQTILRLVVEKIVVTNYRLEIHLALPVSGSFSLTSVWGARRHSPRNWGSTVNSRPSESARTRAKPTSNTCPRSRRRCRLAGSSGESLSASPSPWREPRRAR
jgi:site-specific DNA recombinase